MSFQDFGKSKRVGTTTASATPNNTIPAAPSSGSYSVGGVGGTGSSTGSGGRGDGGLAQISESLLQYQRNVGILEKIVQQVAQLKNPSSITSPTALRELQMQYHVQIDVVQQLEQKVQRQMQSHQGGGSHQIIKLSRDFETVRSRVQVLQNQVNEMKSMFNYSQTNQQQMGNNNTGESYEEEQQRLQLQLQEDRLAEEIMREREEEIRNINRGMHTVNEIYKDLAHIVGSQQEQIDQIETQMEDARANADSGLKQVEKANEKYGSSNCIIS